MTGDPETLKLKRLLRERTKYLRDLTKAVESTIKHLDREMALPPSVHRGSRVALICNALEFCNDKAKRFGLGIAAKKVRHKTSTPPSTPKGDQ